MIVTDEAPYTSRKISNDGALCGMQSYTRIAEAHSTVTQTRRAQRLDTDSARQRLDDAHNESAGRRAKLAVRAKQTSNGTCAKYRMPRRIQNDARDIRQAPTHKNSKAATLHPRKIMQIKFARLA
ncbi:hypothetical protein [uncultured Campylobacter sp.]|uniref:hypothetical protein n=1 Tax=uncultured Campylobacter sp. TaxID=218934 RepID=UPI0026366733|nr:hypothetical protein [uncultured Campylobacter sp.]